MVTASAEKARHLVGLVYPRARLLTRIGLTLANVWFRVRGGAFRTYLHPTEQVEGVLERCGFRHVSQTHSVLWQVATFARA